LIVRLSVLGLLSLQVVGCASAGEYVWFKDVPPAEWGLTSGEYVIGVGDSINIRVYEQEGVSGTFKIRRDGRIALPLVGELSVAGKRPSELSAEIETRLKQFIVAPRVTVNVEVAQPVAVTALGEITKVGALTLDPPARLIEALAQAGGPTDYADKSRIFVLRKFPKLQRLRFTYESILHDDGGAADFPLRSGDVIVIE